VAHLREAAAAIGIRDVFVEEETGALPRRSSGLAYTRSVAKRIVTVCALVAACGSTEGSRVSLFVNHDGGAAAAGGSAGVGAGSGGASGGSGGRSGQTGAPSGGGTAASAGSASAGGSGGVVTCGAAQFTACSLLPAYQPLNCLTACARTGGFSAPVFQLAGATGPVDVLLFAAGHCTPDGYGGATFGYQSTVDATPEDRDYRCACSTCQ
jgi:hypothetical protein